MMHVVKLRMRWAMYGLDANQELGVIPLFIYRVCVVSSLKRVYRATNGKVQ